MKFGAKQSILHFPNQPWSNGKNDREAPGTCPRKTRNRMNRICFFRINRKAIRKKEVGERIRRLLTFFGPEHPETTKLNAFRLRGIFWDSDGMRHKRKGCKEILLLFE
ncbi:hypothetical protein [Desulfoluna spongiiphila]|uniref:hypothetical protein n=1 Tax=Desulfoluna spongiiphila TaxID=419481 RepID=UPI00125FC950|nr:hypothetical protein [Desulfoluna spongiiphila]